MKISLIVAALILIGGCAWLGREAYLSRKKVQAYEQALKAPRPEPLLVLTNQPILSMGNALVLRVTDSEWRVLTNAYPTNVRTDTLTFFKDPSAKK